MKVLCSSQRTNKNDLYNIDPDLGFDAKLLNDMYLNSHQAALDKTVRQIIK